MEPNNVSTGIIASIIGLAFTFLLNKFKSQVSIVPSQLDKILETWENELARQVKLNREEREEHKLQILEYIEQISRYKLEIEGYKKIIKEIEQRVDRLEYEKTHSNSN